MNGEAKIMDSPVGTAGKRLIKISSVENLPS
jgi:hypothetical protein